MHGQVKENHLTDSRNAGLGASVLPCAGAKRVAMTTSNTPGSNSRLLMASSVDRRHYESTQLISQFLRIFLVF